MALKDERIDYKNLSNALDVDGLKTLLTAKAP